MRIAMRISYAHKVEVNMKVSDVQRGYHSAAKQPQRKARLNITVDADLLAAAREQGLNLSMMMESKITETLKADRARQWRIDNKEAIAAYNERIDREGLWSDGLRQW